MVFDLNPKSVGFKDMNPLQVKAFMNFIDLSFEFAAQPCDRENLKKLEDAGSDLIQLFGGNGLKVTVEE